jgi:cytochrome c oxidase subunit IV
MIKGENQQWIWFASEIWNLEFVIATNSWKVLNFGIQNV